MRISDWSSDVCSSDLVEVLAQRIIWSLPLCFVIMLFRRQIGEYLAVLKDWRTLRLLLASALLIAVNWLVYIYAIFTDHVLAASLGDDEDGGQVDEAAKLWSYDRNSTRLNCSH